MTYAGVSFLYIGTLADLMHLIVVIPGLLLGPLLSGRHVADRTEPYDEPRAMRTSAAFGMLVLPGKGSERSVDCRQRTAGDGFHARGIEEAEDPATRVALAIDAEGAVHAVVSWLPIYGSGGVVRGWTLDVVRRTNDGFPLAVDFLITSSMPEFQREGAELASLSGAPLVGAGAETGAVIKNVFDLLGTALEPAYGFRSLHAYKRKFQPRYEPMYLVFRDITDLPRNGIALTRAYLPHAGVADLVQFGRATSHADRPANVRGSRPRARGTSPRASRLSGRRAPAGRAPSRQRRRALLG